MGDICLTSPLTMGEIIKSLEFLAISVLGAWYLGRCSHEAKELALIEKRDCTNPLI
jgi:hypothetical protein